MTKCPVCGSTEIISELPLFAGTSGSAIGGPYVVLDPPKGLKGNPESVSIGFRANICGSCGHTELYTKYAAKLLDAYKQGYVSRAK